MSKENNEDVIARIETHVGHPFTTIFNESAGVGAQWSCDPCEHVEIASETDAIAGEEIGGPVSRKFTAVAQKAGNYILTFRYKRLGEENEIAKIALNVRLN